VFYDKLHFIYLELPKFSKPLRACKTRYEKWLWVFKHLPDLEEIPPELQEEIFVKLFKITEVAKFGKKEREAYQQSLKYLWDLHNVVDTAFKEGKQEGRQEGEEIGLQKGEAKKTLKHFLKILAKFPSLSVTELAMLTELEPALIKEFLAVLKQQKLSSTLAFVQSHFLVNIKLTPAEQSEIEQWLKTTIEKSL